MSVAFQQLPRWPISRPLLRQRAATCRSIATIARHNKTHTRCTTSSVSSIVRLGTQRCLRHRSTHSIGVTELAAEQQDATQTQQALQHAPPSTQSHLIQYILQLLQAERTLDMHLYDTSQRSNMHDYLIVCMTHSARHMQYIGRKIQGTIKQQRKEQQQNSSSKAATPSIQFLGIDGQARSSSSSSTTVSADDWCLVDLGSVMIYVFQQAPVTADNQHLAVASTSDDVTPTNDNTRDSYNDLYDELEQQFADEGKSAEEDDPEDVYDYTVGDNDNFNGLGWEHPAVVRTLELYQQYEIPKAKWSSLKDNTFRYTDRQSRLNGSDAVIVEP